MSGHSRRARAALARMPEVDPAVSALALWCTHRDGPGVTRTKGSDIIYGPAFEGLSLAEQTGLLAHHVLHVALRHSTRKADMAQRLGPGFDPDRYALAADAIVNEVLLQGGHALPRPAVRLSELLEALSGKPAAASVLADWDTDKLYLAMSAAGGATKGAAYAEAKGFTGDLEGDEPDAEAPPELWSSRLEQALDTGRGAGLGIGPALIGFADLPPGSVPWEVHLRRLIARAVADHPRLSHKRPAHRWIAREAEARRAGGPSPVFEPGRARDTRRPRIVLGLDTSSSVTEAQLTLLAAEAVAVARRSGADCHLLGFDEGVHTRVRLRTARDLLGISFLRDGGTDFAPVIAEANQLDPSLIILLTDLDAPVGDAPKQPVIWAVPDQPRQTPGFGTVIVMDR